MCGIWVYLIKHGSSPTLSCGEIYEAFSKIESRGPDRSIFQKMSQYGVYIGFHRLAIMDESSLGDQPFVIESCDSIMDESSLGDQLSATELHDENIVIYLVCNGEIYNSEKLCLKYNIKCKSRSDCEIILHLYKLIGLDAMIKELDGEFSFVITVINKTNGEVKLLIGRDQAGTRHLYMTGSDNEVVLSSELKGSPFLHRGYPVQQFRPRHYLEISDKDEVLCDLNNPKYTKWLDFRTIRPSIFNFGVAKQKIRETFVRVVRSMTQCDREFCCLLSGGVDSSIVAAILAEYCREREMTLHTFCIGTETSTDRPFAEMVAKHIGSKHHFITITDDESLEALDKLPQIIESIDITSNRASCLQYMAVDYISKHTNFKVVFCADGLDECLFGYRYCHYVTSPDVFHEECIRLIEDVHYYDGLRAGMCGPHCGLEMRFPALNKEFLSLIFSIDPILRMPKDGMEKFLFRDSFSNTNYLPLEVLFRKKEAMSDGYSSQKKSFFEIIQDKVETRYTDEELEKAKQQYTHLQIVSKESLHYRKLFEKAFGTHENTQKVIPYYWLPRFVPEEFGTITEPSARILSVYETK